MTISDRDLHLLALSLNRAIAAAAAASALVCLPAAQAQTASAPAGRASTSAANAGGPSWASLSAAQRATLSPLERDWGSIDSSRRAKWLEIATRFPRMPSDEQMRVQDRMAEWARLTPAERGRARMTFQEAKQLSPQERQARWAAYQALPDVDRRALADKAAPSAPRPVQIAGSANAMSAQQKQNNSAQKAKAPPVLQISPTVVQGKPGATTTSISKTATPPAHQHAGQPKIAARSAQVDRATLLPRVANADGAATLVAPKPGP